MTFQEQHDETTTTPQEEDQEDQQELENLIEQLKDNLLKIRELLIKTQELANKKGINVDELDIIIHERYVDALRNNNKIKMIDAINILNK